MSRHQKELKILGERIREKRKEKGFTQEYLAHEASVDRSYMGGVERGERNITFSMLCQIAEALGEDISSFTQGLPINELRKQN